MIKKVCMIYIEEKRKLKKREFLVKFRFGIGSFHNCGGIYRKAKELEA